MGKTIIEKNNAVVQAAIETKRGTTDYLNVSKIHEFMTNTRPIDFRISPMAAVAMASALESMIAMIVKEILAGEHDGAIITSRNVTRAIRSNASIAKIMTGLVFTTGNHYRRKNN